MKTNDLKKGAMIQLVNGWQAKIEDNKKGLTRMATVYGFFTEMGSIYSHDIIAYFDAGVWKTDIEFSTDQKRSRLINLF